MADGTDFPLTRRALLAAAGGGAGLGTVLGQSGGDSATIQGGSMALAQAYNTAGELYIGPDSAKSNVASDAGRVYFASDTASVYYGDGSSWTSLGLGGGSSYTDSDAESAINNDADHGSTASHNYTTQVKAGTALSKSGDTLNVSGVSGTELSLADIAGQNLSVDTANDELDASGSGSAVEAQDDGSQLTTDLALLNATDGLEASNPTGDEVTVRAQNVQSVTSATTAGTQDVVLADASGGGFSVTLPSPSGDVDVTVKKTDSSSNVVTVATPGGQTIDGQSNRTISGQYVAREIVSDGSNYFVV